MSDAHLPARRAVTRGDMGELVGRSWTHSLSWLVILTALGVDVGTFYQVLVNVLNEPYDVIWVVVIGFAVIALTLAHYAGLQARQALDPRNVTGSRTLTYVFASVWLLLGAIAFAVRLLLDQSSGGDGSTFQTDGGPATPASGGPGGASLFTALFFLALYIATGTVTAIAGYFRLEPAAKQYGRAISRRSALVRRHAHTTRRLGLVEQAVQAVERERVRRMEAWETAQAQALAGAERLKQEARLRIAFHTMSAPAADQDADGAASTTQEADSPAHKTADAGADGYAAGSPNGSPSENPESCSEDGGTTRDGRSGTLPPAIVPQPRRPHTDDGPGAAPRTDTDTPPSAFEETSP